MKYSMQTVSKIIGECNEVYKRAIAENLKIWSNPDGSLKPDCCGYGWVEFSDKRGGFARALKRYNQSHGKVGRDYDLGLEYFGGQEATINQNSIKAVCKFLQEKYGIDCYAYTWID